MQYLSTGNAGCIDGWKKAEASIDNVVATEKATFKTALDKWGIDEEEAKLIDPVILTGILSGKDTVERFGKKDGILRGSHYLSYILGFTEKQAVLYKKYWNIRDEGVKIETEELFYKDIISVAISEDNDYRQFTLKAAGISFESGQFYKTDLSETQLQGVKNLIREKKEV